MRSLICTFGFDEQKIVEAMRSISHDEICIVTGVDNLQQDSYLKLLELCSVLRTPVKTVTTDIFDLSKSFETMLALIRELRSKGSEVRMNISGGLPLLSDAALLAAFNEGVVSYYVDGKVLKLPVLRNVTVGERLTAMQKDSLRLVGEGIKLSDLKTKSRKDTEFKRTLIELKTLGLLRFDEGDVGKIVLTKEGESMSEWVMRSERKW